MPTFRVDYGYCPDIKYDSTYIEATDLIDAEKKAEDFLERENFHFPMIDVIEEVKAVA